MNGLGAPSVIPPFALGLGTPLTTGAYGSAIPSLGAFALATTTGIGQTNPTSLRGISNVLLVSNLNEEVSKIHNSHSSVFIQVFPMVLFCSIEKLKNKECIPHFYFQSTHLLFILLQLVNSPAKYTTKCGQTLYNISLAKKKQKIENEI